MIISFEKEVQEIVDVLGGGGGYSPKAMEISMILFTVFDRGFAEGRDRAISIVQRNRNVINPAQVVAEIRKPIR